MKFVFEVNDINASFCLLALFAFTGTSHFTNVNMMFGLFIPPRLKYIVTGTRFITYWQSDIFFLWKENFAFAVVCYNKVFSQKVELILFSHFDGAPVRYVSYKKNKSLIVMSLTESKQITL